MEEEGVDGSIPERGAIEFYYCVDGTIERTG